MVWYSYPDSRIAERIHLFAAEATLQSLNLRILDVRHCPDSEKAPRFFLEQQGDGCGR
jgi:hypothetical protein